MRKYIKIGFVFLSLISFTACLKDFQELNTDPEKLGKTDPRNAFTGATENFNNSSRQHLMGKYNGVMQLMQYIVSSDGAKEGIYVNQSKPESFSPYTPYYYDYFSKIGLRLRYLVNTIIPNSSEPERYQNLAAIANILETYEAWLVFDVNGAAPYTEAFKLRTENIKRPKYDLYQESLDGGMPLYKRFDEKIKENVAVLQKNLPNQYELGKNDYFYNGDVNKWIKFANTLRIKMAQRLEKADNSFYVSVVEDALKNPGGIISNNNESCIYYHPNEYNNNTDDILILTYQYCASRALVNFMKEYNDPRLPILIRRNGFGKGNNNKTNDEVADILIKEYPDYNTKFSYFTERYVGMSANPDSTSTKWSGSAYYILPYKDDKGVDKTISIRQNSQIESRFYVKNGGKLNTQLSARDKEDAAYDVSENSITTFTPLITYPEVCFMMAEISLKSGNAEGGKDALTWFQEGIRNSMLQYQEWAKNMAVPSAMNENSDNYNPITETKINAYLAKPEFQTVTLEKIISQQWVNLYMRPEEAWATWKRTGLPSFKDNPVPVNGVAYLETITTGGNEMLIPRRVSLPAPNDANIENYNIAIDKLKKDAKYGMTAGDTKGRIWWDIP